MNRHKKPVERAVEEAGTHPEHHTMGTAKPAIPGNAAGAWKLDRLLDPYWAGRLVFRTT